MSYTFHDPDMYEPISGGTVCPFHQANPSGHHPGCTCSTYFGYRRVSDETYRIARARKERAREDKILAEAQAIRHRRRAASVDRSPEGGNRETGCHAKHESAVGSEANETPRGSRSSTSQEGSN